MEAIIYSFNIGNIIFTKILSWGNYSKQCLLIEFVNIPYMGINYFYWSSILTSFFLMNLSGNSLSEKCIVLCNYYGFWHKRGNLKYFIFLFLSNFYLMHFLCKMFIYVGYWWSIILLLLFYFEKRSKLRNCANLEGTQCA